MARVGVMGCGAVAEFGHLPAIVGTPGLELVALFDPSASRVNAMSERFGGTPFTDPGAFFAAKPEAIVVASPAGTHLENVLAAAERGIHVLCEKPLAMNDDDAQTMIDAMASAGKMLFTGFVYRFSPVALQIKKWVEEEIAGDIRSLRLIYDWDLHGQWEQTSDGKWIESPRWRGRMLEGGPMVDCGVHQIDLARWWLGGEVLRYDVAAAWVSDYEAPDHVYLHMDHEGGAHTMVEMSFTYGHTAAEPAPIFTYDLIGTGGVIHFNRDGWRLDVRHGQGTLVAPGASEKNFPGMYAAFSEALRTGEPGMMPSGRDGLVATRIARTATETVSARRSSSMNPH
ncbi:Gfo/Idh/MocA family protein [Fimbriimonas ginsengisoli]|uniref:Oxidoreductase n=1 Tax=Fimbriimonas ginsengisoli Gsoil 348 TaxID=661478 RepID=A0A068NWU5_FIMGI|nr:Gfo/Idh/MocA family oxidoreductase [Fimbriimonas ginsengisoli]AIE87988.1 oxidoreductase [Fimbriimonas ginsengisoli Gsoil 348]